MDNTHEISKTNIGGDQSMCAKLNVSKLAYLTIEQAMVDDDVDGC